MSDINILYFASLGERLSCQEERYTIGDRSITVATLKQQLCERGEIWHQQLHASSTKCAVNQSIVNDNMIINANDEVAFFPPVTGG